MDTRFQTLPVQFVPPIILWTGALFDPRTSKPHVLSDTIEGESDRCEEIEMNCFQDGKLIVAERLGHDHITVTCKCGTIRQMVYRRENMHRENGKILSGLLE